MKRRENFVLIIVFLFLLSLTQIQSNSILLDNDTSITNTQKNLRGEQTTFIIKEMAAYIESGNITILNDSEFGMYPFDGEGTIENPYLIKGLNISSNSEDSIYIENTTKYFKIQDCLFNKLYSSYSGIHLKNVTHGAIENNTILNGNCIQIFDSYDIFVKNNTLENGEFLIDIENSKNITVAENYLEVCMLGILGSSLNNSFIKDNFISNAEIGIILGFNEQNNIVNNTIDDCNDGIIVVLGKNTVVENNNIHNIVAGGSSNPFSLNSGITVYDSNNSKINNNSLINCSFSGIEVKEFSINTTLTENRIDTTTIGIRVHFSPDNTLTGNTISNTSSDGITIQSLCDNSILTSNALTGCNVGVYIAGSNFNGLSGNNISDCTLEGIKVAFAYNTTLTGNIIENCTNKGIGLQSSPNSTLTNNIVHAILGYGVLVEDSDNCTLSRNNVYECTETGIYLVSPDLYYNVLIGNTVYNIGGDGIRLEYCHNSTVSSNFVYNCSTSGLSLSNADHNVLSGNIANDCGTYGLFLHSSNNNSITKNSIKNCRYIGISLSSSDMNVLSGNNAFNCTNSGIYISSSDMNIVTENSFHNCKFRGIHLYRSSNNTINYNIIYNNTDFGLYIFPAGGFSDNNVVTMNSFVDNHIGYTSQVYRTSQGYVEHRDTSNNIYSNYWSDWNGTGNYSMDGLAFNNDTSPLLESIIPTIAIVAPFAQEYEVSSINVMLSGSPTIIQYWYYIDGVDNLNQTWTASADRNLIDGSYTLHAYGTDALGNMVYESVIFTVDAYLPTVTITSPTNTTYDNKYFPLTYAAFDGVVTLYLNGMANTTSVPSGFNVFDFPNTPDLPDGTYNLTIVVVDQAGNVAKVTVIFTIETPITITTTTVTSTTTTPEETTTTSQAGSFPGIFTLFLAFTALAVVIRRHKRL